MSTTWSSGDPSLTEIAPAVDAVARMLVHRLAADGINVLSSARAIAGQTVFHMHMHVVPRYADEPGLDRLVNRGRGARRRAGVGPSADPGGRVSLGDRRRDRAPA